VYYTEEKVESSVNIKSTARGRAAVERIPGRRVAGFGDEGSAVVTADVVELVVALGVLVRALLLLDSGGAGVELDIAALVPVLEGLLPSVSKSRLLLEAHTKERAYIGSSTHRSSRFLVQEASEWRVMSVKALQQSVQSTSEDRVFSFRFFIACIAVFRLFFTSGSSPS